MTEAVSPRLHMECAMTTQGDDDMIAGKGCKAVGRGSSAAYLPGGP
ncbi:hypothetical protein [Enterocloster clostridioformis]|nr:hypothetical protein [Enterocloster clostridioformis]MCA5580933.1 hypothetical protein [Enterocloster clostridioformis]